MKKVISEGCSGEGKEEECIFPGTGKSQCKSQSPQCVWLVPGIMMRPTRKNGENKGSKGGDGDRDMGREQQLMKSLPF